LILPHLADEAAFAAPLVNARVRLDSITIKPVELDQELAVPPASAPALGSDSVKVKKIVPKIIPPMSQRLSRVEHCTK
jgi:hypothetical protein